MVDKTKRSVKDYKLSRYACYLIVQKCRSYKEVHNDILNKLLK